jgi:small subunit ribosomal protein S11
MQSHGQVLGSSVLKVLKSLHLFAAQTASGEAAKKAAEHGLTSCDVRVKGPGAGRENAIRALVGAGIRITSVADHSPIPHNGCRAPKRRRV